MVSGQLIAVVGPSGVGKDAVMAELSARRSDAFCVPRVITRVPGPGEAFSSVTEAEFDQMREAGVFALHWPAHGLRYGIERGVEARIAGGETGLLNLSRAMLVAARAQFDGLRVLSLVAPREVLRARLLARGREAAEAVEARLAREVSAFDPELDVFEVSNAGALAECVDRIEAHYFS